MAEELKACPFCGGPAGIVSAGGTFQATCSNYAHGRTNCPAWALMDSEAEAIAAWNRRAATPEGTPDKALPTERRAFELSLVAADFQWGDPKIPVLVFALKRDARVTANMTFAEIVAALEAGR